jgi:hypothetical protein
MGLRVRQLTPHTQGTPASNHLHDTDRTDRESERGSEGEMSVQVRLKVCKQNTR